MPADITGDGIPDFIRVYGNAGAISFDFSTVTLGASITKTFLYHLRQQNARVWSHKTQASIADRLVKITDGVDFSTKISYQPITNSSVYRGHLTPLPHPQHTSHFRKPFYVVSNVKQSSGTYSDFLNEDFRQYTYTYKGAKTHLKGLGFLGFEKVSTKELYSTDTADIEEIKYLENSLFTGPLDTSENLVVLIDKN